MYQKYFELENTNTSPSNVELKVFDDTSNNAYQIKPYNQPHFTRSQTSPVVVGFSMEFQVIADLINGFVPTQAVPDPITQNLGALASQSISTVPVAPTGNVYNQYISNLISNSYNRGLGQFVSSQGNASNLSSTQFSQVSAALANVLNISQQYASTLLAVYGQNRVQQAIKNIQNTFSQNAMAGVQQSVVNSQSGAVTYVVKSGDTLFSIAQRFYSNGNLYTIIAKANSIVNPNLIFAGMYLVIPPPGVAG
jgi:LysM repeat protein